MADKPKEPPKDRRQIDREAELALQAEVRRQVREATEGKPLPTPIVP